MQNILVNNNTILKNTTYFSRLNEKLFLSAADEFQLNTGGENRFQQLKELLGWKHNENIFIKNQTLINGLSLLSLNHQINDQYVICGFLSRTQIQKLDQNDFSVIVSGRLINNRPGLFWVYVK